MPRRRSTRSKDDPVLAEQRRLRDEQERLLAEQLRLSRLVEQAPQKIQEKRRRERESIRLRLVTRPAAPRALGVRDKFDAREPAARSNRRRLARERNLSKLKFILLCAILAVILVSLWMSVPS